MLSMICRRSTKNLKDAKPPKICCLFRKRQINEVNQPCREEKYNNNNQNIDIGLAPFYGNVFIAIFRQMNICQTFNDGADFYFVTWCEFTIALNFILMIKNQF